MLKNLLLSMIAVVFTLFAIELGMRLDLIPNDFHEQMRGAKPAGAEKMRLLILGDSFAQDWHSGTSMYEIMREELTDRGIRILNLAQGGMGPLDYVSEMKAFGYSYRPDLTILFYYVGNDLTNVQYRMGPNRNAAREKVKDTLRPYIRRIYLYHYYKNVEKILDLRNEKDWSQFEAAGYSPEVLELIRQRKINYYFLSLGLHWRNYFLDNILMETPDNANAWHKCEELLAEVDGMCRDLNSRFLIVVFPHSSQINDHQFPLFESLQFTTDIRLTNSTRPQSNMAVFCTARGIPLLDLLPVFKAHEDEDFFRRYDDHFNESGDRLAAEAVLNYLDERGLLGFSPGLP
jgi:hypothetical protein